MDRRRILEEAAQSDASLAEIARRNGIARRVLCRWKQELAAPVFVAVQITPWRRSRDRCPPAPANYGGLCLLARGP
jgi:hypothetical protein